MRGKQQHIIGKTGKSRYDFLYFFNLLLADSRTHVNQRFTQGGIIYSHHRDSETVSNSLEDGGNYLLPRGMPLSHGTRVWQRPQPVAVTAYSAATAAGMVV